MFDNVEFKNYLDNHGYKQNFIARKLNVSEAIFSAIVNGKVKCSLELYVKICQLLKLPFGAFLNFQALTVN